MTDYLLDTNIVSPLCATTHKSHTLFKAQVQSLAPSHIFVSEVTRAEVEFGIGVYALAPPNAMALRNALTSFQFLSIDYDVAAVYGALRAALFNKYAPRKARQRLPRYVETLVDGSTGMSMGIQENDLWIVATALAHNLGLVTADRGGGMQKVMMEAATLGLKWLQWTQAP